MKTTKHPAIGANCACCDEHPLLRAAAASRRRFLKAGAALLAGTAPVPALSATALAQANPAADPDLSHLQSARRILLKGGLVLSLDRQVGDFAAADVLIEDGKIREIRPNVAAADAAAVDAENHIIIPGFIDTHSHSYQGLLRGILSNGLLNPDYNRDVQMVLTPAYQPADAYAGILLTALGMIHAGTTGIVDISQASHTPEHSDAMVRALQESGIRAVYAYHRGAGPQSQYPQDIKRLQRTYFNSRDQLLTLALTANLNADVYKVGREVGVPIAQHIVGTAPTPSFRSNMTAALQALAGDGLMRPGDEYIHCLGLDDAGWRLLKDTGAHVSVCPAIDMTMGHGTPTIQEALDHGFRPSLSTDHPVNITQDAFSVMRQTFSFQRWQVLERGRKGEQKLPPLLTSRDLLEFATIEGARCANIDDKVGTLSPGKEADIVMLRADQFGLWPLSNAAGAVVNQANPVHVENVFIAGKIRKWRGSLVGVDMKRVLRLTQEARDAVLRRANYQVNLLG
jgi:cytosine/adenosine deaminase-related metal-dependent hydrolase